MAANDGASGHPSRREPSPSGRRLDPQDEVRELGCDRFHGIAKLIGMLPWCLLRCLILLTTTKTMARLWLGYGLYLAACATAASAAAWCIVIWGVWRGIDLTDEGYYLNSMSVPFLYKATYTQFGFILHPIYVLVGGDLILLRLAGLLLLTSAAALFVSMFLRWPLISPPLPKTARLFFTIGGSCAVLLEYFPWTPTPNYNLLNFFGVLIIFTGWLRILSTPENSASQSWFRLDRWFRSSFPIGILPSPHPEEHRASDASRRMAANDGASRHPSKREPSPSGRWLAPQDDVGERGYARFHEIAEPGAIVVFALGFAIVALVKPTTAAVLAIGLTGLTLPFGRRALTGVIVAGSLSLVVVVLIVLAIDGNLSTAILRYRNSIVYIDIAQDGHDISGSLALAATTLLGVLVAGACWAAGRSLAAARIGDLLPCLRHSYWPPLPLRLELATTYGRARRAPGCSGSSRLCLPSGSPRLPACACHCFMSARP